MHVANSTQGPPGLIFVCCWMPVLSARITAYIYRKKRRAMKQCIYILPRQGVERLRRNHAFLSASLKPHFFFFPVTLFSKLLVDLYAYRSISTRVESISHDGPRSSSNQGSRKRLNESGIKVHCTMCAVCCVVCENLAGAGTVRGRLQLSTTSSFLQANRNTAQPQRNQTRPIEKPRMPMAIAVGHCCCHHGGGWCCRYTNRPSKGGSASPLQIRF